MKEFVKKILSDVNLKEEFILHHGGRVRKVKNLIDLRIELESMPNEEFYHHVNSDKNDFANWIESAIGDDKLAKDLKEVDSKEDMLNLIKSRIDFAITIIEKENDELIKNEMREIQKISKAKTPQKIKTEIDLLEKDIKKIKTNLDIEKKVLNEKLYDNDLEIIPWNKLNPVPANARIIEFLFGFVVGLILGLLIAKSYFGF